MGYVLAIATVPREVINLEIKHFDSEELLREYLDSIDISLGDIELLLFEGKLELEELESFAISVVT